MSKNNKKNKAPVTESTATNEGTSGSTETIIEGEGTTTNASPSAVAPSSETPATESTATGKKGRVKKEKAPKPERTTPAHMAKVEKFAASLPTLSTEAASVFKSAEELSTGDLSVLSAHITLLARKRSIAKASEVKFAVGDRVRIHSGRDTRFIGKEGEVTRVNRARVFVQVEGFTNPAYIYAPEAELVKAKTIDISDDKPEEQPAAVNG